MRRRDFLHTMAIPVLAVMAGCSSEPTPGPPQRKPEEVHIPDDVKNRYKSNPYRSPPK